MSHRTALAVLATLGLLVGANAQAQQPPSTVNTELQLVLEPKALELLKAMGDRLAGAKSMTFTAVSTYESPARTGYPLAYTSLSEVTLQRPDKLRVITPGDGPSSEFYYDGKTMMAFDPEAQLVATAEAPPTIDAMLKAAYDSAAIYFPFTDAIVADPYKDIEEGLKLAFVVGQSRVVGGTPTDIVAIVDDAVQEEIWIGAEDKLPRMMRATFFNEPGTYRHSVEFSNWHLDAAIPADAFSSAKAASAQPMQFVHPEAAPNDHPLGAKESHE